MPTTFVMGFESKADAEKMLVDLGTRLQKFGLALHEDKTQLIEFGRLPALNRARLSMPRPRTFAFLGSLITVTGHATGDSS